MEEASKNSHLGLVSYFAIKNDEASHNSRSTLRIFFILFNEGSQKWKKMILMSFIKKLLQGKCSILGL